MRAVLVFCFLSLFALEVRAQETVIRSDEFQKITIDFDDVVRVYTPMLRDQFPSVQFSNESEYLEIIGAKFTEALGAQQPARVSLVTRDKYRVIRLYHLDEGAKESKLVEGFPKLQQRRYHERILETVIFPYRGQKLSTQLKVTTIDPAGQIRIYTLESKHQAEADIQEAQFPRLQLDDKELVISSKFQPAGGLGGTDRVFVSTRTQGGEVRIHDVSIGNYCTRLFK